jgi:hypothetical protein
MEKEREVFRVSKPLILPAPKLRDVKLIDVSEELQVMADLQETQGYDGLLEDVAIPDVFEESQELRNEFSLILEEDRSANDEMVSSLIEKFTALLDETDVGDDESLPSWEESSSFDEETVIEESSSEEDSSSSTEEPHFNFDIPVHSESEHSDEEFSMVEKFSAMFEESTVETSSEEEFFHLSAELGSMDEESSLLLDELSCFEVESSSLVESACLQNESSSSLEKNEHLSKRGLLPFVKFPVLLSDLIIEVDIFDSFELPVPVESVMKVEWKSHSLNVQELLPSNIAFIDGILEADIEYENQASLHTLRIQIPWKKTTEITWLYPPEMPRSKHKEYMYKSPKDEGVDFHREQYQQFADQLQFDLRSIHFVWHDELEKQAGAPALLVQGRAVLSIKLLQEQYVDLGR